MEYSSRGVSAVRIRGSPHTTNDGVVNLGVLGRPKVLATSSCSKHGLARLGADDVTSSIIARRPWGLERTAGCRTVLGKGVHVTSLMPRSVPCCFPFGTRMEGAPNIPAAVRYFCARKPGFFPAILLLSLAVIIRSPRPPNHAEPRMRCVQPPEISLLPSYSRPGTPVHNRVRSQLPCPPVPSRNLMNS